VSSIASSYVTSTQYDVDVIVTEHGTADIRATDFETRKMRIANIAEPSVRDALAKAI
jgi:acyl-CoA hydrolase